MPQIQEPVSQTVTRPQNITLPGHITCNHQTSTCRIHSYYRAINRKKKKDEQCTTLAAEFYKPRHTKAKHFAYLDKNSM